MPPPGLTPAERQEMRERSLREARAIARLNNINVVRVFDVLSTDADPWIVMEYVASRSLQDTLAQDGPFNALRAAEIGLGVLNALRAAHRNGVMHRDVKPGNVLLGADGRVVLTDFGLATVPGDPNVTRTGLVLGSPAYIAPERARDGTAGPAADLWSLGATLYAAVEGASPFARPSAIATLAALATENVPVARNAGPLKPVLNGLLRKDPAHRINAEEAERLLSRAAGRRSKITFPMSPTMRRPGVGRERPSLPSGPGGPPVLPGSGWATATGSAPVVPNPRPPVVQPPAADGRPPHFASGKAQVGGQPPEMPRRGAKPLDPTRLDTPPVRDDFNPFGGTDHASPPGPGTPPRSGTQQPRPTTGRAPGPAAGQAPRPAAGQATPPVSGQAPRPGIGQATPPGAGPASRPGTGPAVPQKPVSGAGQVPAAGRRPAPGTEPADMPSAVGSNAPTNALRTGFTAADVAANRRKQAAPEHERSLAQATSGFPVVTPRNAPPADDEAQATSVVPAGTAVKGKAAEKADTAEKIDTPEKAEAAEKIEKPETEKAKTPEETAAPATVDDAAKAETPAETGDEPEAPEADAVGAQTAADGAQTGAAAAQTGAAAAQTDAAAAQTGAASARTDAAGAQTGAAGEPEAATEAEPEEKAAEPAAAPAVAEDKTSIVTLPPPPAAEGEKTSLLLPAARPRPGADEDKTSVVSMPPRRRIITATEPATQVVGDLDADPGFARPSRPAWTPMQMRPVARRTNGITILGTTLTRRQAAIGLGIVLTFLLLVGIIVVQAFGSDDSGEPNPTGAGFGSPAASAPGGKPEGPGGKPDGSGGKPEEPAKSDAPSADPAKPSSGPPSSGTQIPAGWRLYQGSGFRLPVPKSVSGSGGGTGTMLSWGQGRMIRVDIVDSTQNPVDYLNEDGNTGYDKSAPRTLTYKGMPAAEMEYSRSAGGGTKQHVVRRVITVKKQSYVLTWYTEAGDWDAAKGDLETIYAGFEPK
ncbi:hypothetical protein Aph02nite_54380 [Actinoplanes philippinensis]|nr:hypothetical protein Aph02nite_54380 [Actinoplanes philippinensis]